jgi:hypothetical protein
MPRKKIKQKPFIKYGLMALAAHLKLNMKKQRQNFHIAILSNLHKVVYSIKDSFIKPS